MGCFSSSNKSFQLRQIDSSKKNKSNKILLMIDYSSKIDLDIKKELSQCNNFNIIILKPLQVVQCDDGSNVEVIADKIVIKRANPDIKPKDIKKKEINFNPSTAESADSGQKVKHQANKMTRNKATDKPIQNQEKNLKKFDQINNSILKLRELSKDSNIFVPSLNKPQFPVESSLEIKFEANPFEQIFPIWVRSEEKVTFRVTGTWGIENLGPTDCSGYTDVSEKPRGYYFCSLLGRIGGENKLFSIYDGFEYMSSVSGPLFLMMNLGYSYLMLNSQVVIGSLTIELSNTSKTETIEVIDQLLGWNDSKLNTYAYNTTRLFTSDEKHLLILINQLRSDPKQFSSIYLLPEEEDEKALELRERLVKMNPASTVKPSGILEKVAEDMSICLSGNNHIINTQGVVHQKEKEEFPSSKSIYIYENVTFLSRNMPLHFLLHILLDDNNPKINDMNNILCENINCIGISIRQSSKLDWVCVIETSEDYTAD